MAEFGQVSVGARPLSSGGILPGALREGACHMRAEENEGCVHVRSRADQVEVGRMKELITYIAESLVDRPELVQVSEVEGEKTTIIELRVAQEDLGKVIGKQGRTARAMRTILSAAATKVRKRAVLEILE